MRTFKKYFREFFDFPVPRELFYEGHDALYGYAHVLVPEPDMDKACLFVNDVAHNYGSLPVATGISDSYLDSLPHGYYLLGYNEYGCNNYWLYYVRVDQWRRIFMRAHYGGVYTDTDLVRKRFREYLPRYLEFESKLRGHVKQFRVVEDPYRSDYRVTFPDEGVYRHLAADYHDLLINNPDFNGVFRELLVQM